MLARRTAALAVTFFAAAGLSGQQPAPLVVALPPRAAMASEGPAVSTNEIFKNNDLRQWLNRSFPVRLHYRAELWPSHGLFRDPVATVTWDVVVTYNPLPRNYFILRRVGNAPELTRTVATIEAVDTALSRPFVVPLPARGDGNRYYYSVVLEIERLNASDLDDMLAWLGGDVQPAVHGQKNPGTALWSGVMSVFSAVLGGRRIHFQTYSPEFSVEATSP